MLSTLYSTLLTISAGSIVALIATILVFAQVVTGEFSRRAAALLFRNRLVWFSLATNIIAAIVDFGNMYLQSIQEPAAAVSNVFQIIGGLSGSQTYGAAHELFEIATHVSTASLLTAFGFALVPYTMLRLTDYLNAPSLARRITNQLNFRAVREFVAYRYGVEEPSEFQYGLYEIHGPDGEIRRPAGDNWDVQTRLFQGHLADYARLRRRLDKVKVARALTDPFALLAHVSATSVIEHDVDAFINTLRILQERIEVWQRNKDIRDLNDVGPWDPERKWGTLLAEHFDYLSETASASAHPSAQMGLAETAKRISLTLLGPPTQHLAITEMVNFVGRIGSRAIDGSNPAVLRTVADGLKSIGEKAVDRIQSQPARDGPAEVFDQVCRVLGFLGERVALRGTVRRPIMPMVHQEREAHVLAIALVELSDHVGKQGQPTYPLILRDAISLFANRLVQRDPQGAETRETLQVLVNVEEALAIRAGQDKRFEGAMAWVVCNDFVRLARESYGTPVAWLQRDLAVALCQIGAATAIGSKASDNPGASGPSLADNVIDAMLAFPDRTQFGSTSGGPLFDVEWRTGPGETWQKSRDFARRARALLGLT